jgi:vancomycin resistance protein VanJ
MRRGRLSLTALAALAVTAVCLSARDDAIVGSVWSLARWPTGGMALLALGLALRHRALFGASLSALSLGLVLSDGALAAVGRARPAQLPADRAFTVVTHNLLFRGNALDESLLGLKDAGADVIALQEVTPRDAARLVSALGPAYPFHVVSPHDGASGFALFGRVPLSDVRLVGLEGRAPIAQCSTLTLSDGALPVCNVHLSAPAREHVGLDGRVPHLRGFEANARQRHGEWRLVQAELDRRGDRRGIALGDFNSLEVEPLYGLIRQRWVDAFRHTRWAPGATWPNRVSGSTPIARIDYVFIRGALTPRAADVMRRSGSDHLGVLATFAY